MKTLLTQLSLEEKIGQLFLVGFSGEQLPQPVREFIHQANIGFIILFARNIKNANQTVHLTNDIHACASISPFICADQEGGTVVQFKELAATVVSPMGMAATGDSNCARLAGELIGQEMDALGVDGVLAPVLDVNINEDNSIIGIRSFSDDPELVVSFATKFCEGISGQNIATCGKHYPGHGSTSEDSHLGLPVSPLQPDEFHKKSLHPFVELVKSGIDCILPAHIHFPAIAKEIGTFSPYLLTDLLRGKLGFSGVILTDAIEMKAIRDHFSPQKIVINAITAGVDVLSISRDFDLQREMVEILQFYVKNKEISEERINESVMRILALKEKLGLLQQRKKRNGSKINEILRSNRHKELAIADKSITLLKNQHNLIPLNKNEKVLIIEWEKVKATFPTLDSQKTSMLKDIASRFFTDADFCMFSFEESLSESFKKKLFDYRYVIAALYSRNPSIAQMHMNILKQLLDWREDVIVVALGNPYDIKWMPNIQNYLVSYGFREVQLESLFRVLNGEVEARGKLPVHIKGIFPRGAGITS